MLSLYLDTSALASLYIPEALSAAVATAVRGHALSISSLTEVEFASVVARRLRERTLSAADGAAVLRLFDSHAGERHFRRHPLAAETFAQAARLVRSSGPALATLDALHLAIAAQHREPLLTADRQLARAARHFGLTVVLPRS